MFDLLEATPHGIFGETELRRRIDLAIGRALIDPSYQSHLLADPTVALGDAGCSPQQRLDLRGIRAATLKDFATQARALFWPAPLVQPEPRQFASAASL